MNNTINTMLIILLSLGTHINCEDTIQDHHGTISDDARVVDTHIQDMNLPTDLAASSVLDYEVSHLDANLSPTDHVVIEVPMRPKFEGHVQYLLLPNEARMDSATVTTYEVSYALPMVLAEGYPDRYTVHLESPLFASLCNQAEGVIEIQTIDADGITVRQLDLHSFIIEDFMTGTHTINATGIFRPSPNDLERCSDIISSDVEMRLHMVFDVNIQSPTQLVSRWYPQVCQEISHQMMVATSSLRNMIELTMLESTQSVIAASNAERFHQIPLTITAPSGSYLENPDLGIHGLRLGRNAGVLMIESPFGSTLEYTVIDPADITDWSIAWSIAGFAGGGIPKLENHATYDGPWGRTTNRILPVITGNFVNHDLSLCTSELDPTLFILSSQTPENCVVDEQQFDTSEVGGEPMGYSASLKVDGMCTLVLSAPSFNAGQGLESTMSVTVNQVESMTHWDQ